MTLGKKLLGPDCLTMAPLPTTLCPGLGNAAEVQRTRVLRRFVCYIQDVSRSQGRTLQMFLSQKSRVKGLLSQ